jgi:asparagine synthase (glutamine-hydrolysing)
MQTDVDPISDAGVEIGGWGHIATSALGADMTRGLLPGLLRLADRNSMAWSREVRLPYLDHRLIELAMSVPLTSKIAGGWTKEPLRRLLETRGFRDIARRSGKIAYMPPTAEWLSNPRIRDSVRESWAELQRAGIVVAGELNANPLIRWRALSLVTWAHEYNVRLG